MKNDYSFIFSEEVNIPKRYMIISGEIDETVASSVMQAIKEMELINSEPITITINSYGGDSYSGLAIVETIRTCDSLITTICNGIAASAAAEIFAAGDTRIMAKGSILMFHKSSISHAEGSSDDLKIEASEIDRLDKVFAERLAERSNKGRLWWLNRIRRNFYVTAELGKKLGLVEEII